MRDEVSGSQKLPADSPPSMTELLAAWSDGDRSALDALTPLVYEELRRMARRQMNRERAGHTLQPTALVNEAYLKLIDQRDARWQNRAQFFGVAAQLMRRILVDHARARDAAKRGGPQYAVSLSEADRVSARAEVDLIAVNDALEELARLDPQQARGSVESSAGDHRGGAEGLGVSHAHGRSEGKMARAWLRRRIGRRFASRRISLVTLAAFSA